MNDFRRGGVYAGRSTYNTPRYPGTLNSGVDEEEIFETMDADPPRPVAGGISWQEALEPETPIQDDARGERLPSATYHPQTYEPPAYRHPTYQPPQSQGQLIADFTRFTLQPHARSSGGSGRGSGYSGGCNNPVNWHRTSVGESEQGEIDSEYDDSDDDHGRRKSEVSGHSHDAYEEDRRYHY